VASPPSFFRRTNANHVVGTPACLGWHRSLFGFTRRGMRSSTGFSHCASCTCSHGCAVSTGIGLCEAMRGRYDTSLAANYVAYSDNAGDGYQSSETWGTTRTAQRVDEMHRLRCTYLVAACGRIFWSDVMSGDKMVFRLVHATARQLASRAVINAPDGRGGNY